MNQILVTEKIYVTPELKRKKKIYKFNFILSIILIVGLFSFYAYAEYDRNKNEDISKDILEGMTIGEDSTTINKEDGVWIIALDGGTDSANLYSSQKVNEENGNTNYITNNKAEKNNKETNSESKTNESRTGTYTASNGKTYSTVGSVSIPSINVNYPILSETSDSLLKVSVCKFWGCNPNEVGNLCIAGHNYRNKKFFSKAINLVVGDTIEITDLDDKTVQYAVYDKYTVDPNDVSCTSQLTNGKKIVTLITCTNDSQQRVVIKAEAI